MNEPMALMLQVGLGDYGYGCLNQIFSVSIIHKISINSPMQGAVNHVAHANDCISYANLNTGTAVTLSN